MYVQYVYAGATIIFAMLLAMNSSKRTSLNIVNSILTLTSRQFISKNSLWITHGNRLYNFLHENLFARQHVQKIFTTFPGL